MTLEDLKIYTRADELSDEIWEIVSNFKYFERDTLGKQMTRSADSISANIAEGFGRYFYKENRQFCFYARGSLMETKNWVGKCFRRGLIPENQFLAINEKLEGLHKSINAYIKKIRKQETNDH